VVGAREDEARRRLFPCAQLIDVPECSEEAAHDHVRYRKQRSIQAGRNLLVKTKRKNMKKAPESQHRRSPISISETHPLSCTSLP